MDWKVIDPAHLNKLYYWVSIIHPEKIEKLLKDQGKGNNNTELDSLKKSINSIEAENKQLKIDSQTQKKTIESQQAQLNSLVNKSASDSTSLPLGFIYTQLPKQSTPQELWPKLKWTDVTSDYAGLFFRAEGEQSAPFGKTQHANQSWISDIDTQGYVPEIWNGVRFYYYSYGGNIKKGGWTTLLDERVVALGKFHIHTTEGEVRPINTAVRIWKHVK